MSDFLKIKYFRSVRDLQETSPMANESVMDDLCGYICFKEENLISFYDQRYFGHDIVHLRIKELNDIVDCYSPLSVNDIEFILNKDNQNHIIDNRDVICGPDPYFA